MGNSDTPVRQPTLVVLGGCNGAGKTSCAHALLPEAMRIVEYVNMDLIARGLSTFQPQGVELIAGRLMLERIDNLANKREDFAFEATLSGRSFSSRLHQCQGRGYQIHIIYVWLRSAELAVQRVAVRVVAGGHHVPEHVIRRRYPRSVKNFLQLYRPLADSWTICDNSDDRIVKIAEGSRNEVQNVFSPELYSAVLESSRG